MATNHGGVTVYVNSEGNVRDHSHVVGEHQSSGALRYNLISTVRPLQASIVGHLATVRVVCYRKVIPATLSALQPTGGHIERLSNETSSVKRELQSVQTGSVELKEQFYFKHNLE